MRNCNKQTVKEAFTQMKKSGASIDDFCDVELLPGPYMDSAEWEARRHAAATLIQKYVRRSIAKRTADRMRLYAKEKREVQCLSKALFLPLSLSLSLHYSSAIDQPPQLISLCFYLQVFGVL
jgi:hypothetical protein